MTIPEPITMVMGQSLPHPNYMGEEKERILPQRDMQEGLSSQKERAWTGRASDICCRAEFPVWGHEVRRREESTVVGQSPPVRLGGSEPELNTSKDEVALPQLSMLTWNCTEILPRALGCLQNGQEERCLESREPERLNSNLPQLPFL